MQMPVSKCLFNDHTPLYKHKYHQELCSQKAYALKHGYQYHSVSLSQEDAGEAKWHKIERVIEYLDKYDAVLLLDADCLIREDAPDICCEIVEGKLIYMARGHSGRLNSGVIFALSDDGSKKFFREVLALRGKVLRRENFVSPEGENGYIIELSKDPAFSFLIHELNYKWNNTTFPDRPDYVRHFTGPMKKHRETRNILRNPLEQLKAFGKTGWKHLVNRHKSS